MEIDTLKIKSNTNLQKGDNFQHLIVANILQKIGFCYGVETDFFQVNKDFYLETYYGWDFYSSKNEMVLDAICDNIVYFYPLDINDAKAQDILQIVKNAIAKQLN